MKALTRNAQMFELVRFNQSAGPVMFKDEPVTAHHLASSAVFGKIEAIFDKLKDHIVAGQGEDQHYHPRDALGGCEPIARCLQIPDEIAIELRLCMPIKPNRIVKIGQPL